MLEFWMPSLIIWGQQTLVQFHELLGELLFPQTVLEHQFTTYVSQESLFLGGVCNAICTNSNVSVGVSL